eukprot:CAMPEP_0185707098 /NCGR_PEP_ID=MMETSP1164-20130828/23320_1 /TAXON_ID=1104430 /ORGANISM="Chrysoreinhardia sp, Strain CCMP2950" /LENGTH=82 /DNA_ID=CAMNT_0028374519 /DNA_START=1 /DNA_END=245 /DNA_ORIENTATION=+
MRPVMMRAAAPGVVAAGVVDDLGAAAHSSECLLRLLLHRRGDTTSKSARPAAHRAPRTGQAVPLPRARPPGGVVAWGGRPPR